MKSETRRREQVTGVLHSPIGSEQSVDRKNEREDEDGRKERKRQDKTMSDDQRVSRHLWIGTNREEGHRQTAKERKVSGLKKDDMIWDYGAKSGCYCARVRIVCG